MAICVSTVTVSGVDGRVFPARSSTVTVSVTHNGTTTSFTATQGAGGWSFTPPAPWGDGDYT
ncbi:hypothetical protein GFK18_21040, partial [Salmonella enterica subsp. enterica serovar Enteritidis]|nr:hypothetical protein [Salmonella enterica subsp. enterica serovar Enteritidis]